MIIDNLIMEEYRARSFDTVFPTHCRILILENHYLRKPFQLVVNAAFSQVYPSQIDMK